MFNFFKKTNKNVSLHAIANGEIIPIDQVNDAVFSQKFMGDGYAVLPTDGTITSPVSSGKVINVFPTQHAIGIALDNGLEILVHMGIDTVELKGAGFETKVKEGDKLTEDTVLSVVDLDYLKEQGKDTAMIVVITNMDHVDSWSLTTANQVALAKTTIGSVTSK